MGAAEGGRERGGGGWMGSGAALAGRVRSRMSEPCVAADAARAALPASPASDRACPSRAHWRCHLPHAPLPIGRSPPRAYVLSAASLSRPAVRSDDIL